MAGKIMADLSMKLGTDVAELKKGLTEANDNVKKFRRESQENFDGLRGSLEKLKSAFKFTEINNFIGLIKQGFNAVKDFGKSIIEATQFTADKFEAAITSARFATEQFFISLSTWDFSNFIENIKKAAQAGREYAETMDWLGDAQLAVALRAKEANPELKRLEEIFRDTSNPWEERSKAMQEYKALMTTTLQDQLALDEKNYQNILKNRAISKSGLSEDDILFVIKNYDKLGNLQEEANQNIEEYNRLLNASTTYSSGMYSWTVKDGNAKADALKFYQSLTEEQQKWFDIQVKYGKLNDEELKALADAWGQLYDTQTALAAIDTDLVKVSTNIANQARKESEEAAKIRAEREAQLKAEQEIASKKAELGAFTELTPIEAGIVTSNETPPPVTKTINLKVNGIEDLKASEEAIYTINDATMTLTESLMQMAVEGKLSARSLLSALLQTITSAIIGYMAKAMAAVLSKEVEKRGLAGILTGVAAAGSLAAIFSGYLGKTPKAEYGGIVPGVSFYGDKVPVLANSGEMILSGTAQANLIKSLNHGPLFGGDFDLSTKLRGEDIYVILNKVNKRKSTYGLQ